MSNKLVIVESPTKAKTIKKFLGDDFDIKSSYGHIRDLPKTTIGIDFDDNFKPRYRIPKDKKKNVNKLKNLAKDADEIVFATDEDREGEAIAWHLSKAMKAKDFKRIAFHEITEEAIKEAIKDPRDIDMDLVNAQQARRVLDRIVGYKLSPFLWKKVANKLSAGRVQSVALRLIVEREQKIRDFDPETYWTIEGMLSKNSTAFETALYRINGDKLPKPGIMDEGRTNEILSNIKSSDITVSKVNKKMTKKKAPTPFITSTLQRSASSRLNFSAKQTMMFAQRLYENGFITYMRTDSLNLSQSALKKARKFIGDQFGDKYLLDKPRVFKTKSESAQEAHEAIRPTNPELEPKDIDIEQDEAKKLYKLIWERFMGSQLPNAKFERTTVEATSKKDDNEYILRSSGQVMKFDGFLKVWKKDYKTEEIPELEEGETIKLKELEAIEHETQPPPRFNEASLVKTLEEHDIGRPSTYAPIISVIQTRNYVTKDGRAFKPTEIGELVNKVLTEHFPNIVDIEFTADMEKKLDKVAKGNEKWQKVIEEFYGPFEENLEKKYDEVKKEDIVGPEEETDEKCEECGKPMVVKTSRFGKFLGCSGFPDCKNTRPLEDEEEEDLGKCPKCGKGDVVKRRTKKGTEFFGCGEYPDCDFAVWDKEKIEEERNKETKEE